MANLSADAFLFMAVSLFMGVFVHSSLRFNKRFPYTVVLLLVGILFGIIHKSTNMKDFGTGLREWSNVDPMAILFGFIPGLIFESAFNFNVYMFQKTVVQTFWLAFPGVIITTLLIGGFMRHVSVCLSICLFCLFVAGLAMMK